MTPVAHSSEVFYPTSQHAAHKMVKNPYEPKIYEGGDASPEYYRHTQTEGRKRIPRQSVQFKLRFYNFAIINLHITWLSFDYKRFHELKFGQ